MTAMLLLVGCARHPALPVDSLPGTAVELDAVPFYPQQRYQCGPAALATVLGAAGTTVEPEALVAQVWIPERRGALASELQAATRRHGRLAWRLDPEPTAMFEEVAAGRPVLVLQNLGASWMPVWHFAVLVGVDPRARTVVLRSGTERRLTADVDEFLRSWADGGHWALVALRPGELPVRPERARYLRAVADLQRGGDARGASVAWTAWLGRWPDDAAARFGRATAREALHDLDGAAADYEALLERMPEDVRALNNLALVKSRQGCRRRALQLIERAEALASPAHRPVVADSRAQIESRPETEPAGDAVAWRCAAGVALRSR
jgi:hypothetical protein